MSLRCMNEDILWMKGEDDIVTVNKLSFFIMYILVL